MRFMDSVWFIVLLLLVGFSYFVLQTLVWMFV
jgi:hypothetical protein